MWGPIVLNLGDSVGHLGIVEMAMQALEGKKNKRIHLTNWKGNLRLLRTPSKHSREFLDCKSLNNRTFCEHPLFSSSSFSSLSSVSCICWFVITNPKTQKTYFRALTRKNNLLSKSVNAS